MKLAQWTERKTRTLIWATAFSLIAPLASTLFFLENFAWNRLGFALRQGVVASLILCAGLLAYHLTFRRITTPTVNPLRHKLAYLWLGTLFAAATFSLGLPALLALGAGILVNLCIAFAFRGHLLWDALFSGFGFGALLGASTFISTKLFPSPLDDLWLSNGSGSLVFGVPAIQLLVAGFLGVLWGPLISYLKESSRIIETIPSHFHHHHIRAKAVVAVSILGLSTVLGGWFSYTYLLKPQQVSARLDSPEAVPLNAEVLLNFSRPVQSADVKLTIEPHVEGSWEFRNTSLGNRTFNSLAFKPSEVFLPGQEYSIKAEDVKSVIGTGSETHSFTFKSEPVPKVASVTPSEGIVDVTSCAPLTATFEQELSDYWQPNFSLVPSAEIEVTHAAEVYTITPKQCLEQGTPYTLNLALNVTGSDAAEAVVLSHFQTVLAPGLAGHSPQGDLVLTTTEAIEISFTKPMSTAAPNEYVRLEPTASGSWAWNTEGTALRYILAAPLAYGTRYTATMLKGLPDQAGGFLPADASVSFSTIGNLKVTGMSPAPGSGEVKPESSVQISFNHEIVRESIEQSFNISPETAGSFSWSNTKLTFTPKGNLGYSTAYTVTLKEGAKSVHGLPLEKTYTSSFTIKAAPIPPATPVTMALSEEGRAINGYIFGKGSDVIFIHGGIHGGKERSNVVLLERLVKEINANQSLVGSDKKVIIVPNTNPDAYAKRTDKYNARGVNLNINFKTIGWVPWGISEEAPNAGPEPFSERESRAIRDIAQKYNANTMAAFHSKGGLVNPEYGHGPSQALARQYAQQSGYAYYETPEWDYPGTATKWFLENGGGPSITVELSSHSVADWSTHKNALFGLID